MSNPEAPITLQFSNQQIELPLKSTSAYTYRELGNKAISHIWIEDSAENGISKGSRVWFDQFGLNEEQRTDIFTQVLQSMLSHGYEMHLNLGEVHESDMEAFVNFQTRGLDELPEDWV